MADSIELGQEINIKESNTMSITQTIETLIEAMDDKFDRWDMWRTIEKQWHIKACEAEQAYEANTGGLVEAFEAALKWQPLPLVPRPMKRLDRSEFRVFKSGDRWAIEYEGRPAGSMRLKRDAVQRIEDLVDEAERAAGEWNREYGWTTYATEGVDFVYQDV